MIAFPIVKRLTSSEALAEYGATYCNASGLPVPAAYLNAAGNKVYGVHYNRQMIGGFVLGHGSQLRTLEVFVRPEMRESLYKALGSTDDCTEITCFWIAAKYRKHALLNTFIWLCLAFLLKWQRRRQVVFGTCSSGLARLYSTGQKATLIHRDLVNGRETFVFNGPNALCFQAFARIIRHKWLRMAALKLHWT